MEGSVAAGPVVATGDRLAAEGELMRRAVWICAMATVAAANPFTAASIAKAESDSANKDSRAMLARAT
jgi:hypothetical protein